MLTTTGIRSAAIWARLAAIGGALCLGACAGEDARRHAGVEAIPTPTLAFAQVDPTTIDSASIQRIWTDKPNIFDAGRPAPLPNAGPGGPRLRSAACEVAPDDIRVVLEILRHATASGEDIRTLPGEFGMTFRFRDGRESVTVFSSVDEDAREDRVHLFVDGKLALLDVAYLRALVEVARRSGCFDPPRTSQ